VKTTILQDAARLTSADRQKTYGHPKENFANIAEAWSAYLHARGLLPREIKLESRDVAQFNILQKSMRQAHLPHLDNLRDQAGYARTEQMLDE
jgi:hypothetical protein